MIRQDWNASREAWSPELCAHRMVQAWAQKSPHAIAVVSDEETISYGTLDARANQLAYQLQMMGVGVDDLVAISVQPSVDMLVSQLGVLAVGAAYLSLDPSVPPARLAFMLNDAGIDVLITGSQPEADAWERDIRVLRLDADKTLVDQLPTASPDVRVDGQNLAYTIYTSGSTGTPKGVAVTHENLSNLIRWHLRDYPLAPGDRVTQLASAAFDASVWEIWPCLAAGATLYLVSEEMRFSPRRLVRWLVERRISYCFMPTPLAELALAESWPEDIDLRGLLIGGDLYHGVAGAAPGVAIFNHYGPTETTVVATAGAVTENEDPDRLPDIGRPIANTQVYILDERGMPTDVGVPGELYVGGAGVARGYLNRPGLTAERFLPNPFGAPGSRLYRTGDMARYLQKGTIEFLGRVDGQVKIRGFRIELGEIESLLRKHSAVREGAIVVVEGAVRQKQLEAHVVVREGATLDGATLRAHLETRLPGYMVPATVVFHESLPLTATGKIDRRALVRGRSDARGRHQEHAAGAVPVVRREFATWTERELAAIWRRVLRCAQVGRDDDFFALGGDSLLAMSVCDQVQERWRLELSFAEFFKSPVLRDFAALLDASASRARRPDVSASEGTDVTEPAMSILSRVPERPRYPLSSAQARLWFLHQLDPEDVSYNTMTCHWLRGELDVEALRAAVLELCARHAHLRTHFGEDAGEPYQVIDEVGSVDFETAVLRTDPGIDRKASIDVAMARELGASFDLLRGPLWRVRLLRTDEREWLLMVIFHHIITDDWSARLLLEDLARCYHARLDGASEAIPEPSLRHVDFAVFERARLASAVAREQEEYWLARLANPPRPLDLPVDRPRPAVSSHRGASMVLDLGATTSSDIRAFCQRAGCTPYMALLAVFKTLLYRYTGQRDIVVGALLATRSHPRAERVLGLMLNTVVLRTSVEGEPAFRTLLGRVREAVVGAFAHPDQPFERLVEKLDIERQPNRSPLFQVLFDMHNAPLDGFGLRGCEVEPIVPPSVRAKYELTVTVLEEGGRLRLHFEYNTDLYDRSTVERWASHYRYLLHAALAAPDTRVGELAVMSPQEEDWLLRELNATQAHLPPDSVPTLFEERAQRTPDAVALTFQDETWSYRMLAEQANRWAHLLIAHGVAPEVCVAVCVDASPTMVAILLGILEAGGAYAPLAPHYPPRRTVAILEDTRAPILVVEARFHNRFAGYAGTVLEVESVGASLARQPASKPAPRGEPENLFQIVYTSASTGEAKGVMLTRASVLNRLLWMWEAYPFADDERVVLQKSYALVGAFWEIFGGLLRGIPTRILPRSVILEPRVLWRELVDHRITRFLTAPALLRGLLAEGAAHPGESALRLAATSAEPVTQEMVRTWCEVFPGAVLLNLYGSTEDCSDVSVFEATSDTDRRLIPVGKAIRNTALYVLDGNFRPVPVGVQGEIFAGGVPLARGYLGQPGRTAERFLPNPFGPPGSRLYRTGDLGRYLPDGNLELTGRVDHLIKLRGFRIELGEIEVLLAQHPDVARAAVIVRQTPAGDDRLIAFISPAGKSAPEAAQLRAYLRETLPDHMIPAAFATVREMPTTPNGKIDRLSLPDVDLDALLTQARDDPGKPRSPLEALVVDVWKDVLEISRVGIDDSFFDLGGHSLSGVQMLGRLRQHHKMNIPLMVLFEHPTVAEIVAYHRERVAQASPGCAEMQPAPRAESYPLSANQRSAWQRLEQGDAGRYHTAIHRVSGAFSPRAFQRALQSVVDRHTALRTAFLVPDGVPRQVVRESLAVEVEVELENLSHGGADEVRQAAERSWRQWLQEPADLARGGLLRARVYQVGEREYLTALAVHELIGDPWSMGIMARDLGVAYQAAMRGDALALPPPSRQLHDVACWEWAQRDDPGLRASRTYWMAELAGTAGQTYVGDSGARHSQHGFLLQRADTDRLIQLGRSRGCDLFLVMLAACQFWYHGLSERAEIVVGSPVPGRGPGLDETFGCLEHSLMFRSRLDGDPSFSDFLAMVRDRALAAFAHADHPLAMLIPDAAVASDIRPLAEFDLFLAMRTWATMELRLVGATVTPVSQVAASRGHALSIEISEVPEGLAISLEGRLDREQASRWGGALAALLEGLSREPARVGSR